MSEYAALHSIQDLVRWGVSRFHQAELFFGHGTDNAWDESRLLVLHALYLPWETPQEYDEDEVREAARKIQFKKETNKNYIQAGFKDRTPTVVVIEDY